MILKEIEQHVDDGKCPNHGRENCHSCPYVCELCQEPDDCISGKEPCELCGAFLAGPRKGMEFPQDFIALAHDEGDFSSIDGVHR